eukprot:GHVU01210604.1.p1 GENE.GHVU01210604.1~~GHVU01210604.1.p1  ORF type:complete len:380 (+),score=43.27 GHVU01210604.1:28-1140(+)
MAAGGKDMEVSPMHSEYQDSETSPMAGGGKDMEVSPMHGWYEDSETSPMAGRGNDMCVSPVRGLQDNVERRNNNEYLSSFRSLQHSIGTSPIADGCSDAYGSPIRGLRHDTEASPLAKLSDAESYVPLAESESESESDDECTARPPLPTPWKMPSPPVRDRNNGRESWSQPATYPWPLVFSRVMRLQSNALRVIETAKARRSAGCPNPGNTKSAGPAREGGGAAPSDTLSLSDTSFAYSCLLSDDDRKAPNWESDVDVGGRLEASMRDDSVGFMSVDGFPISDLDLGTVAPFSGFSGSSIGMGDPEGSEQEAAPPFDWSFESIGFASSSANVQMDGLVGGFTEWNTPASSVRQSDVDSCNDMNLDDLGTA